jgi:7-cyano-7-deazaguanine synthase
MIKSKINSVLLTSGGMDSTTLAYWLQNRRIDFLPVFINYGQHCAETELETLLRVLPKGYAARTEVLNVSDIYRGCKSRLINEPNLWLDEITAGDLYLPYRNLLLLSIGAAYAQARNYSWLYAAFINSNHAKEIDCSAEFFEKLSGVLLAYGSVEIKMPFREMSKYEVAQVGIALRAPIAHTFSCQAAARVPCGACPNCVDRLEALRLLN